MISREFFKKFGFHHHRFSTNTPVELNYFLRWRILDKLLNFLPFANEIKSLLYRYPFGDRYITEELRINERIVEYPMVFANLNLSKGKICDLGSAGSKLPLELASLGYSVVGVDHKTQHFTHPNLSYVKADLLHLPFSDKSFDRVLLISTVEHIGLGEFLDPCYPDGDFKAMSEARRVVKDNGKVMVSFLTVNPAIDYAWHGKIHRYTPERVKRLFRDFIIEKKAIFNYESGFWQSSVSSGKYACFFFVLAPRR